MDESSPREDFLKLLSGSIRGADVFGQVPDYQQVDDCHGRLKCGELTATVVLEPPDWFRAVLPPITPLDCDKALVAHESLPGNVRYAGTARERRLIADTRLNGAAHLPRSFGEISHGFQQAARFASAATDDPDAVDVDAVDAALQATGWDASLVVRHGEHWELRPRLRGRVVPMHVAIDAGSLRFSLVVLRDCGEGEVLRAVGDQALRFNEELRLVRLSLWGRQLVLESRLHAGLISSDWMETAAYAMAAARQHVQRRLELLSRPDVAECYISTLLSGCANGTGS